MGDAILLARCGSLATIFPPPIQSSAHNLDLAIYKLKTCVQSLTECNLIRTIIHTSFDLANLLHGIIGALDYRAE